MSIVKYILVVIVLLLATAVKSQNISINDNGASPDRSAMLDVSDTTKGLLIPRMTLSQRNLITTPATGLLIFQTDSDSGFYFNQGIPATPNWLKLLTSIDSSNWIKKDTNLYFNTGNVGIGTDKPEGLLHLYGRGSLGAGSRIVFGDDYRSTTNQWNTFVGEMGWDSLQDSDQLQLHGKNGTYFTVGNKVNNSYDTSAIISSFGLSVLGDSTQVGLISQNDSAYWALFSEQKGGAFMPQGAIGLYGGSKTGVRTIRWVVDRDGKMGIGNNAPQQALQIGSFTEAKDQFLSIKTAGGNQFKSGIQLLNFADNDGFTLVSDETQNKFFIQSHNNDTTDVLTIDRITNNVGIGTTSPTTQLVLEDTGIVGFIMGADQIDRFLKLDYNTAAGFSSIQSGLFGGVSRPLILQGGGGNVGVGTTFPEASAILDVSDTARGFLPPRMTTAQMNTISAPASGLFLYNTDSLGYMYYNGSNWLSFSSRNTLGDTLSTNIYAAKVHNNGTLQQQSEDWISSISRPSTGIYNISFKSGIFTVSPSLVVSSGTGSGGEIASYNNLTTSGATIYITDEAGNPLNKWFSLNVIKLDADFKQNTVNGVLSSIDISSSQLPESVVDSTRITDADNDTYISTELSTDEDDIRFFTAGTQNMTIKSGGNVGIGTSDPTSILTLQDNSASSFTLKRSASNDDTLGIAFQNTGNNYTWNIFQDINESLHFRSGANSNLGNLNNRFSLLKSGEVGIGTSTPDSLFHVNGGAEIARLSINGQYSFPTTRGNNGEFLTTDASGVLSWSATPSDGNGIYDGNGSFAGNTTVTQAAHTLAFTSSATNGFSVDGTTFSVDAANNRVGIGTQAPTNPLHILQDGNGGTNGAIAARFEQFDSGNDLGIEILGKRSNSTTSDIAFLDFKNHDINEGSGTEYSMARIIGRMADGTGETGKLVFQTNNGSAGTGLTDVMTLLDDGNVGIGISSPTELLHISTSVGDATLLIEADTDNNNDDDNPSILFSQDAGIISAKIGLEGTANNTFTNSEANSLLIGNFSSKAIHFATNSIVDFTIRNGKVGIGTTSLEGMLSINSTAVSGVPGIYLDGFDETEGDIAVQNGEGISFGEWDGTNFTENMKINSLGNVGIGETSPIGLLSIKDVGNANSGIYLDGFGDTEGDIVVPSTQQLQIGRWNSAAAAGSEYEASLTIDTGGNLEIENELQTTSTGNFHMLPIAMASIDGSDGSVRVSTGNVTCVRDNEGDYTLTVTGHTASLANEVISATIVSSNTGQISVRAGGSNYAIRTRNSSGLDADRDFSIIIYSQ